MLTGGGGAAELAADPALESTGAPPPPGTKGAAVGRSLNSGALGFSFRGGLPAEGGGAPETACPWKVGVSVSVEG